MFLIKWPPLPVYVCFSDGHGHFMLKKEYKDSRYFTLKYQSSTITNINQNYSHPVFYTLDKYNPKVIPIFWKISTKS